MPEDINERLAALERRVAELEQSMWPLQKFGPIDRDRCMFCGGTSHSGLPCPQINPQS